MHMKARSDEDKAEFWASSLPAHLNLWMISQDQGFSTILDDILIDADIVKENYVV